jgi:hypothetical protein
MCGKHKLKAHENNVRRKMLDVRNVNMIMEKPTWARHFMNHSLLKVKVKVTLRLAVYRQSVRLGVKSLKTHDQRFFFLKEQR